MNSATAKASIAEIASAPSTATFKLRAVNAVLTTRRAYARLWRKGKTIRGAVIGIRLGGQIAAEA